MRSLPQCMLIFALTVSVEAVLQCNIFAQAVIPAPAIAAWREMAKAVEKIQYTMRFTDNEEGVTNEYNCSIQGALEKCEFIRDDKRGRDEQVCIHNGRGFYLGKSDNGKWQLSNLRDPGDNIPQLKNAIVLIKQGFSLHGSATLLDVVGNHQFDVLSWRELADGSRNVELKIRDNSESAKWTSTLILQPDKRYRVLSTSHLEEGDPTPAVYESEYADDSLLTEVVPTKHYFKGHEREWNLVAISNKTLPESDFALSYYGLPDYVEPSRKTNWWLWLLIASAIFTIVVFWKTRGKS